MQGENSHTGIWGSPVSALCLSLLLAGSVVLVMFDILDLDLFWHMANGRAMVENRTIVNQEIFSFASIAKEFNNHEWLAQVVLFLLYDWFGVAGLYGLKIFCVVLCVTLLFRFARMSGNSAPLAALVCLFILLVSLRRFIVRPELFSLMGLALLGYLLFSFRQGRLGQRALWGLPLLMVAWDFFHGALFGLALLLSFVGAETIKHIWARPLRNWPGCVPMAAERLKPLWLWTGIALGAMLVSPYGIRSYDYFVNLAKDGAFVKGISEFMPTPFIAEFWPFWVFLAGVVLMLVAMGRRLDLTHLCVVLPFIYLSVRYMRAGAPFALVAAPVIFECLPLLAARLPVPLAGQRLRRGATVAGTLLLVGFLVKLKFMTPGHFLSFGWRVSDQFFPTGPARFIKAVGLRGQMFNTDSHGGYLAYALAPERQIFHYNNPTTFRDFSQYFQVPGLLDQYDFSYAVIRQKREAAYFSSEQWAVVYRSPCALVLVKRNAAHRDIIARYGLRYFSPLASKEKLLGVAATPRTGSQLLKEIITYLAFQRDPRIADILFSLLTGPQAAWLDQESRQLLQQAGQYNPGLLKLNT